MVSASGWVFFFPYLLQKRDVQFGDHLGNEMAPGPALVCSPKD
jgi:hypothetical protein